MPELEYSAPGLNIGEVARDCIGSTHAERLADREQFLLEVAIKSVGGD